MITPKPFSVAEKILRSVFAGDPSIFTAEDLNRQFDAIYHALTKTMDNVGLIRSGWNATMGIVQVEDTWVVTFTITAESGETPIVLSKGVSLTVPTGEVSVTLDEEDGTAVVYLLAKKSLVTFAANPIMSGVNSSEFPTALPSSDTYVYGDERVVCVAEKVAPTLLEGEEIIGIICSQVASTTVSTTTGKTVTTGSEVRHNAVKLEDIIAENTILAADYPANNSIVDALLRVTAKLTEVKTQVNHIVRHYYTPITPAPSVTSQAARSLKINGIVQLSGSLIANLTSGLMTVIGTLPEGHRPKTPLNILVFAETQSASTYVALRVSILTTGSIRAKVEQSGVNENVLVYLDSISYVEYNVM